MNEKSPWADFKLNLIRFELKNLQCKIQRSATEPPLVLLKNPNKVLGAAFFIFFASSSASFRSFSNSYNEKSRQYISTLELRINAI